MIVDVKVPVLAESIAEASLLEWKKQPGEAVARDEILIEIETDKIVLEVPAPDSGVLSEVLKQAGELVNSDEVIARVDTAGAAQAVPQQAAAEAAPAPAAAPTAQAAADDLSPAVRKLVAEHGLDPAQVPASGKDGRLTKGDVLAYVESRATPAPATAPAAAPRPAPAPAPTPAAKPSPPPAPGERPEHRVPMTKIRQSIARRLKEAQNTAAILTTFNEINMGPVIALRGRYKDQFEKSHGVRLGFMSFFAKAAVKALQRFPAVNAYIEGSEIVYHDYFDIGIAVGSPRGLVVPILRSVEHQSFADIERNIGLFADKAKSGTLSVEDLTGGTFTITNGGVFGSLLSTPILNPPQSAILGMHKTQERPVVENGQIVARPMMYVALSYDHRIVDGREAVQFLVTIKEAIEDPSRLLLDV